MRIALGQLNPIVGNIAGNVEKIGETIARSADARADLVVFGELSVTGYPPRDLLRKEHFVRDSVEGINTLAAQCTDIAALVGYVRPVEGEAASGLENAAALLYGGRVQDVHVKTLLPTYDVFDESRYFRAGAGPRCGEIADRKIGVTICEDLWDPEALDGRGYSRDPIAELTEQSPEIIINMSASPFEMHKRSKREELFVRQAKRTGATIVWVNQVGGNDELIFDGSSCAISPSGDLLARGRSFQEDLLIVDTEAPPARCEPLEGVLAQVSAALKLGLRDYVRKCGFTSVVLGLSGGLDSSVVAVLAAEAIGPENVFTISMPSRHSSPSSLSDAEQLAKQLKVNHQVIPIESMHASFEHALPQAFASTRGEVAGENIQARIRGNIIMAVSNAFGHLPLATGNKSELATGYCTLYGDMCGGLAPIGDLLKTDVYALGEQLNAETDSPRISDEILTKPPSAELKPHQTDQEKLPPYDLLDPILRQYIEMDKTAEEIIAEGSDPETVREVVRMVDLAEYKRKQAAPVLKVTARAFGTGRRMPVAQRYHSEER